MRNSLAESEAERAMWPFGHEPAGTMALSLSPAEMGDGWWSAPARPPATKGTGDVTRILLAEDDPYQRRILRVLLASPRISLIEVENGQSAIDLLGLRSFDLVMLDTTMPLMSGAETVAWIRHRMPTCSDVPILGLIEEVDDEMRGQMLSRGMTAWTPKPVSRAHLVGKIVELMPALHDAGL